MSTNVICTAALCRHRTDGVCTRDEISLENAEFVYRGFDALAAWLTMSGDEQFCRSYAPRSSAEAKEANHART